MEDQPFGKRHYLENSWCGKPHVDRDHDLPPNKKARDHVPFL